MASSMNQEYIITTMNGFEYQITQEERDEIVGKTGFIAIKRIDTIINSSSITNIHPVGAGKKTDRSKQMIGISPQGERLLKRFGIWYYADVNEYQKDEDGSSLLVYEGAQQLLPTLEEYETEYKYIAPEQWTNKLLKVSDEVDPRLTLDRSNRTTGGGFQRLGAGN
jgi:hypothetical protein